MKLNIILTAVALAGIAATSAHAQSQGVSKDELLLGAIEDLSGPLSGPGKQVRDGMLMRVEEINEQGGINGRRVKLLVEDSAYDPKRAVLAAQKLVNQDKIFALLGHMGTVTNVAAFPVLFNKNVINFFPVTAAREMYEPFHKLKYAFFSTYYDQIRLTLPKLVAEKGAKRICAMYQDDELGQEVLRGAEDGLKTIGMQLTEKTSYKRGATDFSTQMQKLASEKCDMVVLGTIIRETIGGIAAAKRLGFTPTFLGSTASYSELIHKLGGPTMDGLYAAMTVEHPYLDAASPSVRRWASKYKTKFNEDPGFYSVIGYTIVDSFALAASRTGANLTTDNFIKTMDTLKIPSDMFGSPAMTFSPTKRLGNTESRLSQIQSGRWTIVSDYPKK